MGPTDDQLPPGLGTETAAEHGGGGLTRRRFLAAGAGTLAAGALGVRPPATARPARGAVPTAEQAEALRVLGREALRLPGSRPFPALAAGTDMLPGVDHIVVLMMENHSYDNLLGMLGRGAGQTPRGDGFTLGANGQPTATNPYADGRLQHAFRMPTTCQLPSRPSNEWTASHNQYDNGRQDGFVTTPISPGSSLVTGAVAMGYWTGADLPFTYSLASAFPVCDRYFASLLGQTDPNRRFLIAATSSGMTDDIGTSPGNVVPDATLALPAGGTIFTRLSAAGISWTDYAESYPLGATANLYPVPDGPLVVANKKPFDAFFTDAAQNNLPGFALLDPNFSTQSQENPQNIVVGEAVLAQVVRAIGASPAWPRILFVLTYDEHGGYYDHLAPPVA
ncbi:MAG: alkaline phosphatase family protein, partial [Mycobacteriales bacterium]